MRRMHVYRASPKSFNLPKKATPAATTFPSAWMATALASSLMAGLKSVITNPCPSKVVSRSPGGAAAGLLLR
jgi:hypothetical protein